METTAYSARFLQQRKFYMMLPVLVLPFVTLIYWVLFAKAAKAEPQTSEPQGLMMSLPDPALKDSKALNKLSFYQRAEADSAKFSELIRKDPYRAQHTRQTDSIYTGQLAGLEGPFSKKGKSVSYQGKTYTGEGEIRILRKLNELDAALSRPAEPGFSKVNSPIQKADSYHSDQDQNQHDQMMDLPSRLINVERIEPQAGKAYEDPELKELNGMLDKIIRIQNPQAAEQSAIEESLKNKGKLFSVQQKQDSDPVSMLAQRPQSDSLQTEFVGSIPFQSSGFFGLDESAAASDQNAIAAIIAQDQTLVSGSTVKLSLVNDIYIAGILVPKHSFVYGVASLNNERLIVRIESVRHENNLLPVKLSVYDLDGIAGIYIPGAIARDVAKQSLSQDIQGISIGTLDPSLGAQAASAGIQTVKTLMGKKTRLLQVHLKAGYQVLLKDGNAGV